nr:MAG TPA: hypothetical protein [Bacteriophage sp.]
MQLKNFTKGTFELDQNVTNLEEYEENHKRAYEVKIDELSKN